jgi:hypothetical protein
MDMEQFPELFCVKTGKSAKIIVTNKLVTFSLDREVINKITEYMENPQEGQTILTVLNDPTDIFSRIENNVTVVCSECRSEVASSMIHTHFLTADELAEAGKHDWRKCMKRQIIVEFREVVPNEEGIETLEGYKPCNPEEHYIVRGIDGEIYPIKKSIFEKTYTKLMAE